MLVTVAEEVNPQTRSRQEHSQAAARDYPPPTLRSRWGRSLDRAALPFEPFVDLRLDGVNRSQPLVPLPLYRQSFFLFPTLNRAYVPTQICGNLLPGIQPAIIR